MFSKCSWPKTRRFMHLFDDLFKICLCSPWGKVSRNLPERLLEKLTFLSKKDQWFSAISLP
jgi:hypothetical protein